jgi:hypothetical protein
MSTTDDFKAIVKRLRDWGFKVTEWSGCYGRSNGNSWTNGKPVGHINHHYVCSLNKDQGYINSLVSNLANGAVVNWFADVNGVAYLIGTGPMNHSGTGNSSVLSKTKADQAPTSNPASSSGDMSGNSAYSGTECQHPGDSTPWPAPLLDVMVAINAAEFLQWGYSANRAINHSEWTNRKIDMSAGGGPSMSAGNELRKRVSAQMSGSKPPTTTPPPTTPPPTTPPPSGGTKYTPPPQAYPWSSPDHYGDVNGDSHSHGGYYESERPAVKWIQIRMQELGYAPTSSGWADGIFEQPTIDAVANWQRARHAATTSLPGQVWGDDWHNLEVDR